VDWEPPFDYDVTSGIVDALIEMNATLADIRESAGTIVDLLGEDDGEEEEEGNP